MRQQIKPTRAELRDTKRRLGIVKRGHKLLQRKQESLMVELFKALDTYRKQEQETEAAYRKASGAAVTAEMAAGRHAAWGYAMTRTGKKTLDMQTRQYMGVTLPAYKLSDSEVSTSAISGELPQSIDAAQSAEELLAHCVAQAEAEAAIAVLVDEIERTKRRVNALELKVIPRLQEDATFIMSRLEEMEREGLFSLKRIRAKLSAR